MEANASLRSLEHHLTGDAYDEYVRKLAEALRQEEAGPQDEQRRVAEPA
jgi:hypothetical protein